MTYVFALRDSARTSMSDSDLRVPSNGYLTAARSVRLVPDAARTIPAVAV
jgi:hypothetical protein